MNFLKEIEAIRKALGGGMKLLYGPDHGGPGDVYTDDKTGMQKTMQQWKESYPEGTMIFLGEMWRHI